jgi:hypothetical protein
MKFLHGRKKFILVILNDIGPLMSIKVQGLFVLCKFKSFLAKPSVGSVNENSFPDFELDPREKLKLKVFFQSFWHLDINNVPHIFFSNLGDHLILAEGGKLLGIH